MKEIYALGIGHNTPVLIELAENCGYKVKGLYHYCEGKTGNIEYGYKVLGTFDDLFNNNLSGLNFLLTMGDNEIRSNLSDKIISLGGNVPSLIHTSANISKFANISETGVYISQFVDVQANTCIKKNSMILTSSIIAHNTNIGENCLISFGVNVGAYIDIKNFVFVGIGASLISQKVAYVGYKSCIGAGAVVTKSVEEKTVVAGNPAKIIKRIL